MCGCLYKFVILSERSESKDLRFLFLTTDNRPLTTVACHPEGGRAEQSASESKDPFSPDERSGGLLF